MNILTSDELLLIAKLLAFAFGEKSITLNEADKEVASRLLNKIVDNRIDLTYEQKEQLKALIEIIKAERLWIQYPLLYS